MSDYSLKERLNNLPYHYYSPDYKGKDYVKRLQFKGMNCSDTVDDEALKKLMEKLWKQYIREKTKAILSLPIPMSYEVWSELHRYLERLG